MRTGGNTSLGLSTNTTFCLLSGKWFTRLRLDHCLMKLYLYWCINPTKTLVGSDASLCFTNKYWATFLELRHHIKEGQWRRWCIKGSGRVKSLCLSGYWKTSWRKWTTHCCLCNLSKESDKATVYIKKLIWSKYHSQKWMGTNLENEKTTSSNTGLLLFTSSTPTMTRAVEESGWGPPDVLSSVAVTFRTYSRPWSFGKGVERRRINPAKSTDPLNYTL